MICNETSTKTYVNSFGDLKRRQEKGATNANWRLEQRMYRKVKFKETL